MKAYRACSTSETQVYPQQYLKRLDISPLSYQYWTGYEKLSSQTEKKHKEMRNGKDNEKPVTDFTSIM